MVAILDKSLLWEAVLPTVEGPARLHPVWSLRTLAPASVRFAWHPQVSPDTAGCSLGRKAPPAENPYIKLLAQ